MTVADVYDDRLARRHAVILSVAQALYNINVSTVINLGGIIGASIAFDRSNATLPITTMMIGTMLATAPASLFMQRFGRRAGFMVGSVLGLIGSLVAAYAVYTGQFLLFCLGTHLIGYYQASAQYFRFAATDTASPEFRPRAISWVLAGGLVAAFFVPYIISGTKDVTVPYVGCFLAAALSVLAGLVVVSFIRIPLPPRGDGATGSGRPLLEIVGQPRFLGALAAGMISYGMMALAMTASPLAIVDCGFSVNDSASSIRWHVLAMFAPSFFTGSLIARFGRGTIVLAGMALLALSGVVSLSGLDLWRFDLALVLLGVGWNFGFIGATAMIADSHRPEERGKVQAFNDLLVFGFVAICSYLSGHTFTIFGWGGVNAMLLTLVALGTIAVILLPRLQHSLPAAN